jgi:hypothetical protein
VSLPPVLKRAYRQQDGGYVRGNDRGVRLNRLHMVEPVEDGYMDYVDDPGWSAEGERFDAARLFYQGWDDTGANVLLHPAGWE